MSVTRQPLRTSARKPSTRTCATSELLAPVQGPAHSLCCRHRERSQRPPTSPRSQESSHSPPPRARPQAGQQSARLTSTRVLWGRPPSSDPIRTARTGGAPPSIPELCPRAGRTCGRRTRTPTETDTAAHRVQESGSLSLTPSPLPSHGRRPTGIWAFSPPRTRICGWPSQRVRSFIP